jgi:soluble P-type ATPase
MEMIEIDVPGYKHLKLAYLVLDYNGTLACDGELLPGVEAALIRLAEDLQVHVLTADTFGVVRERLTKVPCELTVLPKESQDQGKLEYVRKLGLENTACVGNGRNDRLMLREAVLGIAVILGEGAARETLEAADIVCTDILAALELFRNPLRMTATLRS